MHAIRVRGLPARAAICCLVAGLTACAHRAPRATPTPVAFDPTAVVATAAAVSTSARVVGSARQPQPTRQLIRRGRMAVEVSAVDAARERLEQSTTALGGQVSRATVEERERAEYIIRVPPDRLDALMDSIAVLGHVESRSVAVDDVTESVIDVEARLTALRASRDRLRQLFDRATTTQDVITVERELARVQSEIESLEARLSNLRGQVALSELSVSLQQRAVLGPLGVVAVGVGSGLRKLFVWR